MLFWTLLKVALKGLLANKLRSFLAMLGIIIGVAAVISMLALGAGAQQQVVERISSMGTNLLVVHPSWHRRMGVVLGTRQNLTLSDAEAILSSVKDVKGVAPVVRGSAQLKYYNKNTRSSVIGTATTYFPLRNYEIERGRSFTEGEVERSSAVAVLGSVTAENLFGVNEPIGEVIKINNLNFRVIGVLKPKGETGPFSPDDMVVIPYTSAMKRLFGMDYLNEINIQATSNSALNTVQEEVTSLLRKRHKTPEGQEDDFRVFNQAELLETMSDVTRTFTILLGSIAGISMLVGGIGIMNIMLVTVTERTREIGIRKAIGAKNRDIMRQFLIESCLMSGLGGALGVAAGVGGSKIVEKALEFPTSVEITSILLALSFAVAVGIFFGYYPAQRAALLDPIEALRYE
ncbi:MAG: ABC transporter permease [Planctomycetota bacterium]|nr:ABC transporter permease [Planctomycetota bacterium]